MPKAYIFLLQFFCWITSFAQTAHVVNQQIGFTIKNVQFKNAGTMLRGNILTPKNPSAAVVIVHGSGQEKRSIEMASRLAQNGIAVLTYDKRGVNASEGVYAGPEVGTNNIDSTNLNLLASDASKAVSTLGKFLPKKIIPLGLIGASQAGWIIPLAAAENKKVQFMVIFSGPIVTTLEQLRFQFYTNGNPDFWTTTSEEEARKHIKNDKDRYQFKATDPIVSLSKLEIPGLWLFGGKDIQVPVGLSIERMNKLKVKGKAFDHQIFPLMGHNLGSAKSSEPFDAAVRWIKGLNRGLKK